MEKVLILTNSFALQIIVSGIIVGAVGFILGFLVSLFSIGVETKDPLFSIILKRLLSLIIGLINGAIYWKFKKKKVAKL